VLGRGQVPADVVFVGEGPGKSEDSNGEPFVGQAGKLLDDVVASSVGRWETPLRVAFSNLLACIPWDDQAEGFPDVLTKVAEPPFECVEECKPRLLEFMKIADPKLIVCVGKQARDWLQGGDDWTMPQLKYSIRFHRPIALVDIQHPAYPLHAQMPPRQKSIWVLKQATRVTQALEALFAPRG
jgi:DNA polymerase